MCRILLVGLGILLMQASCRKSSMNGNGHVQLNHCMDKRFNNETVSICFDSLLTESRCPLHAVCVWQGYALGKFTFKEGGHEHGIKLGTISLAGVSSQDTTISGYTIRLINILPYPGDTPVPTSASIEITR